MENNSDAKTLALMTLIAKKHGGGGGSSTLSDLDDVSISSPQGGEILKYDTLAEKWVNSSEGGKILTGTLTAGQTTVSFSNAAILADSLISVYADVWYSSYSQSAGSFSLTFPVQSADMAVTIEVK